jgi:hypothetical protein
MHIGNVWPLAELWVDKAKKNREILDKIMRPYIDAEFAQKREALEDKEGEGKTLLSSLVQYTDGEIFITAASTRKIVDTTI